MIVNAGMPTRMCLLVCERDYVFACLYQDGLIFTESQVKATTAPSAGCLMLGRNLWVRCSSGQACQSRILKGSLEAACFLFIFLNVVLPLAVGRGKCVRVFYVDKRICISGLWGVCLCMNSSPICAVFNLASPQSNPGRPAL